MPCIVALLLFIFIPILVRHSESIGDFISLIFRAITLPIRLLWKLVDAGDIEEEDKPILAFFKWIIFIILIFYILQKIEPNFFRTIFNSILDSIANVLANLFIKLFSK